jgi:VanZ family protein
VGHWGSGPDFLRPTPNAHRLFVMPSDSSSPRTTLTSSPADRAPVRRWLRLLLAYGPPLLLMLLIFAASGEIGSSAHSGRIIGRLLVWLGLAQRLTPEAVECIHYVVRKAGHVLEYALLAVLMHRAVAEGRERWSGAVVPLVVAMVSLYAASDELHQSFIASRTPSIWDWLLDSTAAALALVVKWRWEQGRKRRSSG